MIPSRIGWEPAILVVLGILAIFLFPVAQGGPYSAVNGPVTALQASRAAHRIKTAMLHSAQALLLGCAELTDCATFAGICARPMAAFLSRSVLITEFPTSYSSGSTSALRC